MSEEISLNQGNLILSVLVNEAHLYDCERVVVYPFGRITLFAGPKNFHGGNLPVFSSERRDLFAFVDEAMGGATELEVVCRPQTKFRSSIVFRVKTYTVPGGRRGLILTLKN